MMMEQSGVDFPAGNRYRYSNTGYALLAMIVERIAGCPFPEFLDRHLFSPAGMAHSLAWDFRGPQVFERAYGHEPAADGNWIERDQSITSSVLGDGGVYTSIREYALWDRALASGSILSPQSMRLAMTPGRLDDGTATGYGFGWRLEEKRGLLVAHHTGATVGFRSFARRIPAIGLCTLVFSNRSSAEAWELAPLIEDLALDELKDLLP
jgi:CubicO group peptidase (beta-lactamase class C family)